MTKTQKIWLGVCLEIIFLGMAIVPEILWSPVLNFIYEWNQNTNHVVAWRSNFLTNSDNIDLWSHVLLFQFLGLFFATVLMLFYKNYVKNKIIFWIIFVIFVLMTLFVLNIYGDSTIRISLF
jgi:hypothetical protein